MFVTACNIQLACVRSTRTANGMLIVRDVCPSRSVQRLRAHHFKGNALHLLDDPAVVAAIKPELLWQLETARDMTQQQVRLYGVQRCS